MEYKIKHNKVPTFEDINNAPNSPSGHTYIRRFGSWNNALKAVGMLKTDLHKYNDEFLISELKRHHNKYGKPPSQSDFTNNPNYPHYSTYQSRFGSWSNALKLAELDFDSMLEKGEANLDCSSHKGRLFELLTKTSFKDVQTKPEQPI